MSGAELLLRDENYFYEVVQTTPDYYEALDLLEAARSHIKRRKEAALRRGNSREDQEYARTLTRIAAEKKRINMVVSDMYWHDSIRQTLGEEALGQVLAYRIANYRDGAKIQKMPLRGRAAADSVPCETG